jgi:hypothetical protein
MTDQREQIVQKLVTTGHLSVSERYSLGTACVVLSQVAGVVTDTLTATGFFPSIARPWQNGTVVHEAAVVRKLPSGAIRLHLQRASATDPFDLLEQKTIDFADLKTAVEAFIRTEWPAGIDGIPILQSACTTGED